MPTVHSNQAGESGLHIKLPRLAGFTLLEQIHEGSCGSMYRARQDRLGRVVALKLMPEWPPPTDVALERFNRAAYVSAQTPHPNLLTLYDTGTKDGFHYISLEYLSGQTLQKYLSLTGACDERFAVQVAVNVLRGLVALHSKEICHRNVKPKNIFLETNGTARLIGLGLASCKTAFFSPHLDARPIGTPHFMAPEMIRGCYADPRSDLYSLGVTLFVITAGRTPFEKGSPLAVMSRHLTDAPTALSDARPGLSKDFVGFVEALMAREPAHRFQTAKAALETAEALLCRFSEPAKLQPELILPRAHHSGRYSDSLISKDRMRHAILVAGLSALGTVLFLAATVQIVTWYTGKMQPAAAPILAPVSAEAEGDGIRDSQESAEFDRLMQLDQQFQENPVSGAESWAGYLAKYPGAPRAVKTLAKMRMDLYLGLDQARNQAPKKKPVDVLDF
jgi:serine/threonine protein kinase